MIEEESFRIVQKALKQLYIYGVAPYNAQESYPQGAVVTGANQQEKNSLYISQQNYNQNQSLDDEEYWLMLEAICMPVGSTYVQYPGQTSPQDLWPSLKWSRLNYSFSGAFFRTEGGYANPFEQGLQADSAPNIYGEFLTTSFLNDSVNENYYQGAFMPLAASNPQVVALTKGRENEVGYKITFNAEKTNMAYGRRSEVAPHNQTVAIWRRMGAILAHVTVYKYDEWGRYIASYKLDEDSAGIIGFNPNCMTRIAPPVEIKEGQTVVFNRLNASWEYKSNKIGQVVYHKKTAMGRTITQLGDDLTADETTLSPEELAFPLWNEAENCWQNNEAKTKLKTAQEEKIAKYEELLELLSSDYELIELLKTHLKEKKSE